MRVWLVPVQLWVHASHIAPTHVHQEWNLRGVHINGSGGFEDAVLVDLSARAAVPWERSRPLGAQPSPESAAVPWERGRPVGRERGRPAGTHTFPGSAAVP